MALFGLWLVLIDSVNLPECTVGAVAALLGGCCGHAARIAVGRE